MQKASSAARLLVPAILAAALPGAEGLGCRPPTADEQAWMDEHLLIPDVVRLNATAIGRLNAERRAAGLPELAIPPAAAATEVVGRTATARAAGSAAVAPAAPAPVPAVVDNSTFAAFPPVGSQGSLGSCACYSTTYYTMTYMVARARGIDAKTGGSTTRYSPKFCYNLINGGADAGSWITTAYAVQQNHGVPTLAAWPYDADYRAWPTTAAVWRGAIPSRMGVSGVLPSVDTAAGLLDLKRMLANGYVLNFATDIYGWQFTTLGNDPGTTADDAFAGQQVCHWYQTDSSGHAMTVVGYNDNLWVDLNGNGTVEAGERGALKIVNNWGSGWRNGGSAWILYDALKAVSAVDGWSGGSGRTAAWWGNAAYWIAARPEHQPTVLGEFTLSTAKRSQLMARLGLSTTALSAPTTLLGSSLQLAGGDYAFDGTTSAVAATMVLDFTDRVPAGTSRFYLRAQDGTAGSPCQVSSFALTDGTGAVLASAAGSSPAGGLPQAADAGTVLAWADLAVADTTAPAAITDLAATLVGPTALTLVWTATGDDGRSGTASAYDVRFSSAPITAGNWAVAGQVASEPVPRASGTAETFQLSGASPGTTVYFAVAAIDETGQSGPPSNVLAVTTPGVLAVTGPAPLPAADPGVAYAATLEADGGTGTRTWSHQEGHAERDPGSAVVAATGSAQGWRADSGSWTYAFPSGFTFPFAGAQRSSVRVSSDGFLEFGSSVTSASGSDTLLAAAPLIAVCWKDLTTAGTAQAGEDVYIRAEADAVTIRWVAESVTGGVGIVAAAQAATPVDAQVTLRRDGTIEMAWRLAGSAAYIGVSDGDAQHWARSGLCWAAVAAGTQRAWDMLTWPTGLVLDPASGALSGSIAQPGIHKLGIRLVDSGYPVQSAAAVLTLAVGVPAITSALSASGTVGTPFSYQITAANAASAPTASGLPAGLACDPAGLISGVPLAAGTTQVALSAGNALGTATATLEIAIAAAPASGGAAADGGGGGGGGGCGAGAAVALLALSLGWAGRRSSGPGPARRPARPA